MFPNKKIKTIEELIGSHEDFINEILIFLAVPDPIELGFDFDMLGFCRGYLVEVEGDVFLVVEFAHQGRERERAEEVIGVGFSFSNGIHVMIIILWERIKLLTTTNFWKTLSPTRMAVYSFSIPSWDLPS